MMEVKTFSTIIDLNGMQDKDSMTYIKGRIGGMMCAICDYPHGNMPHALYQRRTTTGEITGYRLFTRCTPEEYMLFKEIVEKYYPGFCQFDL